MKKKLLVLLAMFIGFGLSAQIYYEDFDSFADGDYLQYGGSLSPSKCAK